MEGVGMRVRVRVKVEIETQACVVYCGIGKVENEMGDEASGGLRCGFEGWSGVEFPFLLSPLLTSIVGVEGMGLFGYSIVGEG